jgi:ABC-type branched-subunit amino acid transport system substrate-binding protein
MTMAPGESNVVGLGPMYNGGLNIAVQAINAAGGIDGHQIQFLNCDVGQPIGNLQGEQACSEMAVGRHVLAVVGPWFLDPSLEFNYLQQQSIPAIADIDAGGAQDTSPLSWIISFGTLQIGAFDPVAAVAAGCKKLAQLDSSNAGNAATPRLNYWKAVGQAVGIPVDPIVVGPTQTDFAPIVAEAAQFGADCIDSILPPTTLPALLSAIKGSGRSLRILMSGTIEPESALAALGSAANGFLVEANQYPPGFNNSPQLNADWAKYGNGVPMNGTQLVDWETVEIFAMAAKKMLDQNLPITASNVQKELGTLSSISFGVQPTIDFSQPSTTRNFDNQAFAYTYANGKYTQIGSTPLTLPASVKPPTGGLA